MSAAEEYVIAYRNTQALWSNLSTEERKQAQEGLRWLEVVGEVYTGPKLRGRPPGAKNRKAQVGHPEIANQTLIPAEERP